MLRLKTFKVPEDLALRLSNRTALLPQQTRGKVTRGYVERLLQNPPAVLPSVDETRLVLRSYYLTPKQDDALTALALKLNVTKGKLFRLALASALGTR